MQMKKLKNEKGVMTIYVAVSVLTFVIILTAVFSISVAIRKQQIKTIIKIKESYEQDLDNKQTVYENRAALEETLDD